MLFILLAGDIVAVVSFPSPSLLSTPEEAEEMNDEGRIDIAHRNQISPLEFQVIIYQWRMCL